MTYADGVFLVVPYGETGGLRSVDGVNWEEIELPAAHGWNTVCGIDGRISVLCDDTIVAAYTEDKGTTWQLTEAPSAQIWYHSTVANGRMVAVAESANVVAYSDDGIEWHEASIDATVQWCSVAYGNGKYVACGRNSDKVIYSTDGENWTTTSTKSVYEIIQMPREGIWIQYGDLPAQKIIVTDTGLAFEELV